MGNLVSWALVQDAIVKKKKRNGDWSIRSSSISNEAIPSDKGCDTWTRQSISACKGLVFNRECTRYAGQSARHRQSMGTPLRVDFDFSKVDWKKKEENSDSCTGNSVKNRDRNFLFGWKEFDGTRFIFFLDICPLFLVYCFFCT